MSTNDVKVLNVVVSNIWKNLALVSLGISVVYLGGCTKKPTNTQLELWRKEASNRNAEILADKAKKNPQRQWNLAIQGETASGKSQTLNWPELLKLATTDVNTSDAKLEEVLYLFGANISLMIWTKI